MNAHRYGPVLHCSRLFVHHGNVRFERTCLLTGGITISKRRNRLKCDIVEALQCVQCLIHHDLLFCQPGPSSSTEEADEFEFDVELDTNDSIASEGDDEEDGWDVLLLEDDEDDIDIV